ncbi:MAG: glycosyltransferase, partial [Arenicellales bacterium]|nr:glycosyltransferase [Arenicellales bacterium]
MIDNSLTVVVPVFNEAQSLPTFLPELVGYCREHGFQLIFVDDASTDESASLIQPECNGKMCRLI